MECRTAGPPTERVGAGNDFYLSRVAGTSIVAEFLVLSSEQLIICKQFH